MTKPLSCNFRPLKVMAIESDDPWTTLHMMLQGSRGSSLWKSSVEGRDGSNSFYKKKVGLFTVCLGKSSSVIIFKSILVYTEL